MMKWNSNLKMAENMKARLASQEEQINILTREISGLRDGLFGSGTPASSSELEDLRSENEKLKYRLVHLRRGLENELELEAQQGKRDIVKSHDKKPENKQPPKNRAEHEVIQFACLVIYVVCC